MLAWTARLLNLKCALIMFLTPYKQPLDAGHPIELHPVLFAVTGITNSAKLNFHLNSFGQIQVRRLNRVQEHARQGPYEVFRNKTV